jgi:hypothetical protein
MNIPDKSQVIAFGRHVVSFGMGGIAFIAAAHLFQNPTDATDAANAVTQVSHGFKEIMAGGATLISIGMGVIASIKTSPLLMLLKGASAVLTNKADVTQLSTADQQKVIEATDRLPKVAAIVTNDKTIAALTVSPTVVSTEQAVIKQ